MADQKFELSSFKPHEGALSAALTEKAQSLGIIPMECRYECHVTMGPDGKPVVTCGINCGF